jgi:hypothetical protein
VDKTDATGKATVAFVAKDAAITKAAGTDPAQIAATLDVACDDTPATLVMPPGDLWRKSKKGIARYVDKDAPATGPVKLGVIKPGCARRDHRDPGAPRRVRRADRHGAPWGGVF